MNSVLSGLITKHRADFQRRGVLDKDESRAFRQSRDVPQHTAAPLRTVKDGRLDFSTTGKNNLVELLHGAKDEVAKVRPQVVPQGTLGFHLLPYRTEQRTACLLDLIDQEGQHHQHGEDHGEMLVTVSIVMFVVVALVLQRVERLVLDSPTSPAAAHQVLR